MGKSNFPRLPMGLSTRPWMQAVRDCVLRATLPSTSPPKQLVWGQVNLMCCILVDCLDIRVSSQRKPVNSRSVPRSILEGSGHHSVRSMHLHCLKLTRKRFHWCLEINSCKCKRFFFYPFSVPTQQFFLSFSNTFIFLSPLSLVHG